MASVLKPETKDLLKQIGRKDETYDEIVRGLIKLYMEEEREVCPVCKEEKMNWDAIKGEWYCPMWCEKAPLVDLEDS